MAYIEIDATGATTIETSARRWSSLTLDPNSGVAVQCRAEVLAAAWRDPVSNRTEFIVDRCAGRRVLDVGCVAHDEDRMNSGDWLHRHIANAADDCLGVDVLASGIDAMVNAGYNAVVADLSARANAIVGQALFQVIVAGEVIEHVASLDMLFETAANFLTIDGELIITTPNPYAPSRVRAGRRGETWENADHIMYAFPSGIAELAERHGLVLAEATTCDRPKATIARPMQWIKRTIRRSHYRRRGYATTANVVRPIVMDRRDRLDNVVDGLVNRVSSRPRFTGETAIYVVTRGTLR